MDRPTFPPKFSKVLVTPDPQYIPGYAGYCPQLKYNMGQSYGQMTHKLLTNPEGRGSSRWVLSNGRLQSPEPPDRTVCRPDRTACRPDRTGDPPERTVYGPDWTADGPARTTYGTDRTTRGPDGITDGMDRSGHAMRRTPPLDQGERRNLDTMIPGYTGFVPKRQKYYAQTYSQTCRGAFTEFNRDQNSRRHLQPLHPPVVSYRSPEFKVRKLNTPLNTVSHGPTPPKDPEAWEALGSPYLMDDQSPHKYFISGFTGYVPKSRFLIGRGYPATTNEALIQFGGEMQHDFSRSADGMRRKGSALPPVQTVYPSSQGLLPFYTGHVPGYKYTYGDTFGKLTHNALGMSGAKRSIGVKL